MNNQIYIDCILISFKKYYIKQNKKIINKANKSI